MAEMKRYIFLNIRGTIVDKIQDSTAVLVNARAYKGLDKKVKTFSSEVEETDIYT